MSIEATPRTRGAVDVWQVAVPTDPGVLADVLAESERAWLSSARHHARAATRAALRCLIGRHLCVEPSEVVLDRACRHCGDVRHGKPAVLGSNAPRFNVSHSGDLGLVGIAMNVEIGIDIECARDRIEGDGLRRRVLSEREIERVRQLDPERRWAFLRLWAAKEAVAKADGRGLTLRFADLDLSGILESSDVRVRLGATTWIVRSLGLESPAVGFVATEADVGVSLRDWSWC